MCFLPLKSSHCPSRPVPVTDFLASTRPVPSRSQKPLPVRPWSGSNKLQGSRSLAVWRSIASKGPRLGAPRLPSADLWDWYVDSWSPLLSPSSLYWAPEWPRGLDRVCSPCWRPRVGGTRRRLGAVPVPGWEGGNRRPKAPPLPSPLPGLATSFGPRVHSQSLAQILSLSSTCAFAPISTLIQIFIIALTLFYQTFDAFLLVGPVPTDLE